MGNKGPVRYRKYTDEFKVEAIRLAESVGVVAAAKRLGMADDNLRNWIARGVEASANPRNLPNLLRSRWQKWKPRTTDCVESWRARNWI